MFTMARYASSKPMIIMAKIGLFVLIVAFVMSLVGTLAVEASENASSDHSAIAQDGGDDGGGDDGGGDGESGGGGNGGVPPDLDPVAKIIKNLGGMAIKFMYFLMFIVFAVGTVKSGLAAQAAQQFGMAGQASMQIMNIAAGVLIFLLGVATLPLANFFISEITNSDLIGGLEINIPDITTGE